MSAPSSASPVRTPDNQPVFVSGQAVQKALAWTDCVDALETVYGEEFDGSALPARVVASTPQGNWMRVLPALPGGGDHFGLKVMGGRRAGHGRPYTAQYLVVLFDKVSGAISAFVDARAVTGIRTAATSALAARRLTRRHTAAGEVLPLGVLGTGLEARMHVRALTAVLGVGTVTVFSTTESRRRAFADEMGAELGLPIRAAASAEEAVRDAELVVAAARSHDERPIVSAADLNRCRTLVSIGSTVPSQREIDVDLIERSDLIVCDVVDEATSEAGDFLAAARAGIPFDTKVHALSALVGGELDSRAAEADLAIFKSVGSGLQDVAIASLALARAREAGLTAELPMGFEGN
ncbi:MULTISPECIES: ornithine cyclodeaminase family protein [Actinomadura]|uniref:ornithine cyclodeaminase family protein n=1 Tax=Actinomadura TaxID=1988 RepID=UPI0007C52BFF|nr:ornithine cyclodeaminase family protein [Actinomadura madurae]SPT64021.1 ectoine utilization protein EutC [Actinomadura madurae]